MTIKKKRKKRSPIWKLSKSEFINLINKSNTFREVLSFFELDGHPGNYKTLKERIKEEGIDTNDLLARSEISRNKRLSKMNIIPLEKILVENSKYHNSQLKNRLISEGLLIEECSECHIGAFWNGKPLVLQLEHKNGNRFDNRLENLTLLCPNCHSQTDTFTGKRNKKYIYCNADNCNNLITKKSKSGYCGDCFRKIYRKNNKNKSLIKNCSICSKKISFPSKTNMCSDCFNKSKAKVENRPSKEGLAKLILTKPFTQIGKDFDVSDNAVRKWCKSYNLPYRKKDIEQQREQLEQMAEKELILT